MFNVKPSGQRAGLRHRRARVQIAVAMLSGNSLRQTVHTHRASVHQAAKLAAALLRVARVNAGLVESNGSLPPGLWLTSPAGWLPQSAWSRDQLRNPTLGNRVWATFLIACWRSQTQISKSQNQIAAYMIRQYKISLKYYSEWPLYKNLITTNVHEIKAC